MLQPSSRRSSSLRCLNNFSSSKKEGKRPAIKLPNQAVLNSKANLTPKAILISRIAGRICTPNRPDRWISRPSLIRQWEGQMRHWTKTNKLLRRQPTTTSKMVKIIINIKISTRAFNSSKRKWISDHRLTMSMPNNINRWCNKVLVFLNSCMNKWNLNPITLTHFYLLRFWSLDFSSWATNSFPTRKVNKTSGTWSLRSKLQMSCLQLVRQIWATNRLSHLSMEIRNRRMMI